MGVGAEVAEQVDLVVPAPGGAQVGGGRMGPVGDLDLEFLGPGMAVEAGPDKAGVVVPAAAGVGGGVDAQEGEPAGPQGLGDGGALVGGPGRLPDGEQRQDAPVGQLGGGEVGHLGHRHRLEPGQSGQLGQGRGGLGEHAVDPAGPSG